MKIGYFCYYLSGTGPRTRARDIINAVSDRTEHETIVLTNQPEKVTDSATVREVSISRPLRVLFETRKAFSDVDVVQVPINIWQVLFVRVVYHGPLVAGVGPGIQPELPYRLLGRALNINRKIIVHEKQEEWERTGYDTTVCTATIDTDEFYPYDENKITALKEEMDLQTDRPIVLYVGELREHKGANIVSEMAKIDDTFEYVVVGDGPLRPEFEDREDLRYLGFVDNDRMPDLYNVADVTIGPRDSDNTSNVGLESIACGTPYVTTADGDIRDLFEEDGAYIWAERSPEGVIKVIQDLVSDLEYYQSQVKRGLETIQNRPLTLDEALETHLSVYEELVTTTCR